ncbi:hypothetical protein [Hyphomicrobium sp. CS1BSMeth3]|uniref:hypothetical protein n=1 Tax=Hyphomicrobium sp. CS1BSMeth3 TaxID=1892844 RepID=UPI00093001E8|nr:hypothetical protein [Hyphomicrobium sp. CS1BSMeth3]
MRTIRQKKIETDAELSPVVCWTRMQAEAGQPIEAIIARKELERKAGDGLFCWGIGSAPPRSLGEVSRGGREVDVVFSLMKSRPKPADVTPAGLVVWRSYIDAEGRERDLPVNSLITSGAKSGGRSHYALMCRTDQALALDDLGPFDPSIWRNVSEAGRPVGASQVTALVRRVGDTIGSAAYRVNLRAVLTKGYWVKLGSPLQIPKRKQGELLEALQDLAHISPSDWLRLVMGLKWEGRRRRKSGEQQLALFAA